jgi:hypothetical protein
MKMEFQIDVSSFEQGFLFANRRIRNGMSHALQEAVEETIKPMAQELVPLDKGPLQASWFLNEEENRKELIEWKFGYTQYYAELQHETPWFKHAPGRSWQYLRIPMKTQFIAFVSHLTSAIKALL